ncbi:uncharacterized protein LOC106951506 [Poecilia latipinna]|uniref:uncharacterized protein LOC106951506 n=1 Tax=Poecilia latipinna TaxID=48699 RepID=UPI00072EF039|nr:PREDICTED: uncharacterized protein LOC106951506 [Poecilia latipinna]XP_014894588.1 PREDICTED: uncharacterized protein LOC106951506 [Poecilia latipinna]XP_014894589.1 PREDICTED: uncharacterized protein LOC106951506 [Poecilia latipinna]
MNQAAPSQRPVIPQVRYHPSIQMAGSGTTAGATRRPQTRIQPKMVQKNQNSNRTGPAGAHGPPDNDPGPTADQASSKQGQSSRPGAARHTQARTDPRVVQKNQDSSRTDPCLNGGPEPKRDLGSAEDKAPPTPDQVPLDPRAELDRNLLQQVEVLTRGQSTNQDWFHWRKNRITASVAHRIAHSRFVNGKSKAPPLSYLAAITGEGPKVRTRAMSWGIEKEAEVVCRYQTLKSAALGQPVRVLECGLFIDSQRPWLAASPDGIVVDARSGRRLLCLEVKCPYKHRHRSVEDACRDDPAFCLQLDGDTPGQAPVYALKKSHSYFTQIQVQLAVTGLDRADLVVFTLKETAIVPVSFDPDLWDETVSKLEVFYRDAVLPHLRQKMQQNAAAGPEL